MPRKPILVAVLTVVAGFLIATIPALAGGRRSSHSPANGGDADEPYAGLISDAKGNLYGTAMQGGTSNHGAVFQLVPGANDTWNEAVLYSFNGTDGTTPFAALVFDGAGNLYGATQGGGAYGYGTVFQLAPGVGGTWTETVLHSFNNNGQDGYYPYSNLIFDAAGNLYGTTSSGGSSVCGGGCGTVFELTPAGNGTWAETLVHSFAGSDGEGPSGLTFDGSGNLYATTAAGGTSNGCGGFGCGNVFELTPGTNGTWTETVLYNFTGGSHGGNPIGGVIFDASGNLYGQNNPYVFRLARSANGTWTEKVLYRVAGSPGGLIFDAAGNLYGMDTMGGKPNCKGHGCGTIFELAPGESGKWKEKVLHSFNYDNKGKSGYWPYSGLIFDAAGNLYGTTLYGGSYHYCASGLGCGTAFQLMPNTKGTWTEKLLHSFGTP
jgi:uncharacterized repeat protein (TIGR03803 family)